MSAYLIFKSMSFLRLMLILEAMQVLTSVLGKGIAVTDNTPHHSAFGPSELSFN